MTWAQHGASVTSMIIILRMKAALSIAATLFGQSADGAELHALEKASKESIQIASPATLSRATAA